MGGLDNQLTYWNTTGVTKTFTHPVDFTWLRDLAPTARILDYGCGYGRVARLALDEGLHRRRGRRHVAGPDREGPPGSPRPDVRHPARPAAPPYRRYADVYGTYGVFDVGDGAVCRHHSAERLHALLDGFTVTRSREITVRTMNANSVAALQLLAVT
jgi:hypothetical protein